MAFEGYHIKLGGNTLPEDYIAIGSYAAAPNQRAELDSYRDANGVLHRTVNSHTTTRIEWTTPYLSRAQKAELIDFLLDNMTDVPTRTFSATYYDDESDSYKTGDFYMPDIAFQEYGMDMYQPISLSLIEY